MFSNWKKYNAGGKKTKEDLMILFWKPVESELRKGRSVLDEDCIGRGVSLVMVVLDLMRHETA